MEIIEVTVVGMKYQGLNFLELKKVNFADCSFRSEFQNPHDKNAVAFFWKEKKIGYVQKKQNIELKQFIKETSSYRIHSTKISLSAINIRLVSNKKELINRKYSEIKIPNGKLGIYCIKLTVGNDVNYYVGQSQDIRSRLLQHFLQLDKGSHHNLDMQKVWSNNPRLGLSILEEIKPRQSDYETQVFLGERERYWIEKYSKKGYSLNIEVGGTERTKSSNDDFDKKLKSLLEKIDGEARDNRKNIKEIRNSLTSRFGKNMYSFPKLRGEFGRDHENLLIESAKGNLIRSGAKAEVDRIEKLLAKNRVLRRHKEIVSAYENQQKRRGQRYSEEYDKFQVRHESFFELLEIYGVR